MNSALVEEFQRQMQAARARLMSALCEQDSYLAEAARARVRELRHLARHHFELSSDQP